MGDAPAIRLIVVDAHAIFRAGVRQICSSVPAISVIGEASRGADALVICERLRPDLLLLDGALPGVLSLIAQIREHHPDVGVAVLADRLDEAMLRRALQLGVVGYLLKQIEAFELVQAIRSAASGLLTLAPEMVGLALTSPDPTGSDREALSEREQAVLSLLLHGLSNSAIAARLRVSRSTVKFHLRNIYGKLGVCSRTEAVAHVYGQRRSPAGRAGETPPELPRRPALPVAV